MARHLTKPFWQLAHNCGRRPKDSALTPVKRQTLRGSGRLVAVLMLAIVAGAVLPTYAQSNLPSLWLGPSHFGWWSLTTSPDVWVKCARTGRITDTGVKLLISPELGPECVDILQNSIEYRICSNIHSMFNFHSMIESMLSNEFLERLEQSDDPYSMIEPMLRNECIEQLNQPDARWPHWHWRLEEPLGMFGWDSAIFLMDSESLSEVQQKLDYARREVEYIVQWAGDIWHIDLDVDGRAARVVEFLHGRVFNFGTLDCPVEAGDIIYDIGEDGSSVQMYRAAPDGLLMRIYQLDEVNRGHERKRCVRFHSRERAVAAIEELLDSIEDGMSSDAELWEGLDRRIRAEIGRGFREGTSIIENPGFRAELHLRSTLDQRPYRTLKVLGTEETIELWIGREQSSRRAFVKVKWVNLPGVGDILPNAGDGN